VVQIRMPGEAEPHHVTESGDQGLYDFPEVDPGLYILETEHPDFASEQRVVLVAYEGGSTMDVILPREAPG